MGDPDTKPVLILTVPLWQVAQVCTDICVCTNRDGTQFGAAVPRPVVWQVSHTFDVGMWLPCLPTALTPLWQLKQPGLIPVRSKLAPSQVAGRWQSPHSSGGTRWPLFWPGAHVPLWQMMQKPWTARGIRVRTTLFG